MSGSEQEPGPDAKLIETLARQIGEIILAHVVAWGNGNKPRLESVAALAIAFATVLEHHSDADRRLMATWFEKHKTLWLETLNQMRPR